MGADYEDLSARHFFREGIPKPQPRQVRDDGSAPSDGGRALLLDRVLAMVPNQNPSEPQ